VVAENEPQHVKMIRPADKGGYGMDGLWNDDYHHSAVVALTGRSEAYYTDYRGTPQEFVSAMKYGYLYQGQWYKWQTKARGTPALNAPKSAFITFIENHDQVANSARGLRMRDRSSPAMFRAITALTVLGPCTPMLFQGQEFGSQAPFLFFADLPEALREPVRKGRQEFVHQWRSIKTPAMTAKLHDPCARETFEACKLDHSLRESNAEVYRFHCDLIRLKRTDPVLSGSYPLDGAVLGSSAFLLRYFGPEEDDRMLIVNFGADLDYNPAPEPLIAPPEGMAWRPLLCTESPQYGGSGAAEYEAEGLNWQIPGHAAALFAPVRREEEAK
jgi:maltooligosyltrehalose trehalohydrolase